MGLKLTILRVKSKSEDYFEGFDFLWKGVVGFAMILKIQAALTEPPSSVTVFRDTTLYATAFCDLEVLLECEPGTRSSYWRWLKSWGAHDFVEELVREGEEGGLYLGKKRANIRVDKLDHPTYPFVIDCLRSLRQ